MKAIFLVIAQILQIQAYLSSDDQRVTSLDINFKECVYTGFMFLIGEYACPIDLLAEEMLPLVQGEQQSDLFSLSQDNQEDINVSFISVSNFVWMNNDFKIIGLTFDEDNLLVLAHYQSIELSLNPYTKFSSDITCFKIKKFEGIQFLVQSSQNLILYDLRQGLAEEKMKSEIKERTDSTMDIFEQYIRNNFFDCDELLKHKDQQKINKNYSSNLLKQVEQQKQEHIQQEEMKKMNQISVYIQKNVEENYQELKDKVQKLYHNDEVMKDVILIEKCNTYLTNAQNQLEKSQLALEELLQ
ncbi:hypothetical protein ABPG74_011182 [Tetrahymena malaccensis]